MNLGWRYLLFEFLFLNPSDTSSVRISIIMCFVVEDFVKISLSCFLSSMPESAFVLTLYSEILKSAECVLWRS